MNLFSPVRTFLFRCRYGFRGVPVLIGNELLRVDESLRRWKYDSEAAIQRMLREHLRVGDVFFDIGANFGIHTLYAARIIGPSGHVFAFEPVAANLRLLRRNLRLSGVVDRVTVVPKAVSNSPQASIEMYLPTGVFTVTASLCPDAGSRRVCVLNVRLDDLSASDGQVPRVIKIDVEGAEFDVLRGAENLLRKSRPVLLIEVHGFALPSFGASVAELRDFLRELGYREILLDACQYRDEDYFQALYK